MTRTKMSKARVAELLSEVSPEHVVAFIRHLRNPGEPHGVIGHINEALDRGISIQEILGTMPSHYWLIAKSLGDDSFSFGYGTDKTFLDDSGYWEQWTIKFGELREILSSKRDSFMFID